MVDIKLEPPQIVQPVKVVKAVKCAYEPSPELFSLMDTFRGMVNEAIRVAEKEGITSRFSLIKRVYQDFKNAILHRVANQIVEEAREKHLGIVLEDLTDIHKSINKKRMGINPYSGKKQRISVRTKSLKRRLNSWSFKRLQNFIEYKAKWQGIPVFYIDPKYTSSECPVCGQRVEHDGEFSICEKCGLRLNRHLLACLNILKRKDDSLWFGLDSLPSEAVIRPLNKAVSRRKEVADATEPQAFDASKPKMW